MARLHALIYDPALALVERAFLRDARARLLQPLRGRVLEIGAGTGLNLPHHAPEATIIVTEPDPDMLARARRRAGNRPHLHLLRASAQQLPLPDASVDHAVSTLVLCTVPDPRAALAELHRVLTPTGTLHLLEHVRSIRPRVATLQDVLTPAWKHVAGGCHLNRDTAALAQQAGFTLVKDDWLPAAPALLPMRVLAAVKQ